jgi:asparagine synthase (glutamine-hydrolysing)
VTNRVPAAADADESRWQEAVVEHLGLADWIRLEWDDELDATGPIAQQVLRRHGLLWPINTHFHQPLLAAAAGGSLLTGVGGDELFGALCPALPGGLVRGAFQRAPAWTRRPVLARRRPLHLPWLTPAGRRAATLVSAAHAADEPSSAARRLAWARSQRYLGIGEDSLARLATAEGAEIAHPLLDRRAWAALAAAYGARGLPSRTEAVRRLFGDLLPPALIEREDKAGFDEVFCGPHTRALAAAYSGAAAPPGLVDAAKLRAHWERGAPYPQSLLLLQAEWLSGADRVEQRPRGGADAAPHLRPAQVQHG